MDEKENNTAVAVAPTTPPTLPPAGDNRERIIILQDVSGDRTADDPNPPPVWDPVEISAANYREMLEKKLRPTVTDAVPDPVNPGAMIGINVLLDVPTSEWIDVLPERVPELKVDKDRLAALDQLEILLMQRAALDGDLAKLAKELFGI